MKTRKLKEGEVSYLKEFTKKGQKSARALLRTYVLLLSYKEEKEMEITEKLNINRATVFNFKKRNDSEKKIKLRFTRGKVDEKMSKYNA